ncbi:MAG: hypothetical protein ACLFQB_03145, partial [Chitinispirillaceae bacterium]
MKSRLILVEGIPGVGKSTTLSYIKNILDDMNIPSRFYYEADIDHPADYEGVACLDKEDFSRLKSRYRLNRTVLKENVVKKEGKYFISYRKMIQGIQSPLSEKLFRELSIHDVYFLPPDDYSSIFRSKWREFVRKSQAKNEITVFECSFFQNPLTMLVRHNAGESYIQKFYNQLTEIVESMNPVLILLLQENVGETLERISRERPKEWLDFVIRYVTRQEYGREHQLEGFAGMVDFYKALRILELRLFEKLDFKKLYLSNPQLNYENSRRKMEEFLKKVL